MYITYKYSCTYVHIHIYIHTYIYIYIGTYVCRRDCHIPTHFFFLPISSASCSHEISTMCCSVLQFELWAICHLPWASVCVFWMCVAVHYSVLQSRYQHSVVRCVAACCRVWQCVAVCCSAHFRRLYAVMTVAYQIISCVSKNAIISRHTSEWRMTQNLSELLHLEPVHVIVRTVRIWWLIHTN